LTAQLAFAALRYTLALRDPAGTTLHSDRESRFLSRTFVEQRKEFGITRLVRRLRGDEAVLLPTVEERAGEAAATLEAGLAAGDCYLDRTDVPPAQAATETWPTCSDRIRIQYPTSRSRRLTITDKENRMNQQQSPADNRVTVFVSSRSMLISQAKYRAL